MVFFKQIMAKIPAAVMAIVLLACSLGVFGISVCPQEAYAMNRGNYADQFLDGSKRWNEGILNDYDGGGNFGAGQDMDTTANNLVGALEDLTATLFRVLLGFAIVLSVARMVGRAIIEMLDIHDFSGWPKGFALFFHTSEERGKLNNGTLTYGKGPLAPGTGVPWVWPMILETMKYLIISLVSLTVLFLIANLVASVFGQIEG